MNIMNKYIGVLILGFLLYGCASSPQLSQEQIQQQYSAIAQLEQAVKTAQLNNVNVLAPQGYASAERRLSDAYAAAKKGQTEAADKYAKQGLDSIQQATRDAGNSTDLLSEVLGARDKALKAGARELYPQELAVLERKLSKTAGLVEKGDVEDAKQIRPELRQSYAKLELNSIKEGTVQRAKAAISRARDNDADKLAPKTFKSAQESLAAAISVLEADRTARGRAEVAAKQALIDAERSENIAELVRDFDRRDSTPEDVVLWYQAQLSDLATPLNKPLSFNEPNKKTVGGLQQDIAGLMVDRQRLAEADTMLEKANANIAQLQQKHQQEVAQLKKEFVGEKTNLSQAQQAREEQFNRLQQMFTKDEATVYRQGDNVLISVRGFKFPSGSSEIQPQNFGIMNKIVQGIATFKAAMVKVEGHTDATGSNEINKSLSEQRAENVARFLSDVGHIPPDRITAEGYGAQQPVASNATPEGRAENRRIDVLIINK